jgi:II/X family phage/plasmid replication protein
MIDYITAKFPVRHDCASLAHFKNGYFKTWLRHKATAIEVTSVENGRFLIVSGNPVKYLQGHNIFGSDNLQGLCRDLIKVVLVQLGINLGRKDQQAINAGLYSFSRVDLAVNFRLPSGEMLSQAIREIEWHWRELGRNVSNYGDETVYHDQYSKVASTKFYNKAKEIRARPLSEKLLGADACTRLRRYADRLLRAEFTLRSPALKTQRLNRGSEWTTAKTRALIQEKNRLPINSAQDKTCRVTRRIYPMGTRAKTNLSALVTGQ